MSERKLKTRFLDLAGVLEHRGFSVNIPLLAVALIAYFTPQRVLVIILAIACLIAPLVTLAALFALVTFSPLRKVPQPKRSLLMGFGGGAFTGLFWLPVALSGKLGVTSIVVGIVTVAGALIGLLGSAETISTKTTDEFI